MPECKHCGEDYSENVIEFHKKRCKSRANSENVGPDNTEGEDGLKEININEVTTREAPDIIERCDDIDQIMDWLAEETQNKDRKTIVELLEGRMKELEG